MPGNDVKNGDIVVIPGIMCESGSDVDGRGDSLDHRWLELHTPATSRQIDETDESPDDSRLF